MLLRCYPIFEMSTFKTMKKWINFASHSHTTWLVRQSQGTNWIHVHTFILLGSYLRWVLSHLQPPCSINALGELTQPFQVEQHIGEYVKDFCTLVIRDGTVQTNQRVNLFTRGLDETVRIDVEPTKPYPLNETTNISCDFLSYWFHLLGLLTSDTEPEQPRQNILEPIHVCELISPSTNQTKDKFKFLTWTECQARSNCTIIVMTDEKSISSHKCNHLSYVTPPSNLKM